jgi:FkbM family methyltransferase
VTSPGLDEHFAGSRNLAALRRWRRRATGAGELIRRAGCVRERARFLAREVRQVETLSLYHLRRSRLPFWLRHATPDVFALDQAFVQGHFELPRTAESVLHRLRAPTVVDLGANIGLFGLSVLERHPQADITAFEPDTVTAAVLARTIHENARTPWTLVDACAARTDGWVSFESGRFGVSRVVESGLGTTKARAVDVFPYLASADLIKIDIEGSEWSILLDDRFALLPASVIHLEYHGYLCPEPDPRALAERILVASGYSVTQIVETSASDGILVGWRGDRE